MSEADHACDRQLRQYLDELATRSEEVAEEATKELGLCIAAYGEASDELGDLVHDCVQNTFTTLLMLWREGRPITPTELEPLVRMGIPPISYGITLEEVLHAYRLAAKVIHSHLERVAPNYDLDASFLITSSQLMWQYLNDLSTGLTRRWRQLEREQLRWREDLEQALVRAALEDPTDLDQVMRMARTLGIVMAANDWRVVVAEPNSLELGQIHALVSRVRSCLRRAGLRPLVGAMEGYCVVMVQPGQEEPAVASLRDVATVGVSRIAPAGIGLRQSFVETRSVVDIARRRGSDVLWFDDTWVERFLLGSVSPREFTEAMLAPVRELSESRQESVMETLGAFLRHQGRVTEMARDLHLHPQSVRYRLKQVRKTFGEAYLDDPCGRLGLHMAVEQLRLMSPVGGQGRDMLSVYEVPDPASPDTDGATDGQGVAPGQVVRA